MTKLESATVMLIACPFESDSFAAESCPEGGLAPDCDIYPSHSNGSESYWLTKYQRGRVSRCDLDFVAHRTTRHMGKLTRHKTVIAINGKHFFLPS